MYNKILEYRRPLVVLLAAVALPPLPTRDLATRSASSAAAPGAILGSHGTPTAVIGTSASTPATAAAAPSAALDSASLSRAACYKLLVYMRCIFRGVTFPPRGASGAVRSLATTSPDSSRQQATTLDASSEPRAQVRGEPHTQQP